MEGAARDQRESGFRTTQGWRPEPPKFIEEENGAKSLRHQDQAAEQEREEEGSFGGNNGEATQVGRS